MVSCEAYGASLHENSDGTLCMREICVIQVLEESCVKKAPENISPRTALIFGTT